MNTLYFGDNLDILAKHIADESVDLVYLDPPFNSNRDYNVLFREQSGRESPAQIKAFGDTWNWAGAAEAWAEFKDICPVPKVIELMHGFRNAIGENDVMAYLIMMAPRLYHLHRVLKPTGSLYLHCDTTASHYLKLVLDGIFGAKNFKNHITWRRTSAHNDAKRKYGKVTDTIFYYTKSDKYTFNVVYSAHEAVYLLNFYRFADKGGRRYRLSDLNSPSPRPNLIYDYKGYKPHANGWRVSLEKMEQLDAEGRLHFPQKLDGRIQQKRYLDEMEGTHMGDAWDDIKPVASQSAERLGYPTQKPLALLERILTVSSNPGDVVLDPFAGCGTTIVAAQKIDRQWIGIDITTIATTLIQKRLADSAGIKDVRLLSKGDPAAPNMFRVEGLPVDKAGAIELYNKDTIHKEFEMWAVGLIPGIPQQTKGADRGIDGLVYYNISAKAPVKAVVQVKGGKVSAAQVRDLRGVMAREKAALGFFLCIEEPTQPMRNEAKAAGFYKPETGVGRQVDALQLRTIEELLTGHPFDEPIYGANVSFRKAEVLTRDDLQGEMEL